MPAQMDDGLFLNGQLQYVTAQSYDPVLTDLPLFSGDFPITNETPEWAIEYTWRSFADNGADAAWASDYDDTWPSVDVGGSTKTRKIYEAHMSFNYTEQELVYAQHAGINLDARRAKACRRKIDEKLNNVALSGDTDRNIPGFINYPGISEFAIPANGTGSVTAWSAKTAANIMADLYGVLNVITTTTKGMENPDTLRLPRAQYNHIAQTPFSSTGDNAKSILQVFKEANPGLDVGIWDVLATAGASSVTRMIAYKNSPDKIKVEIPVPYEVLPVWNISPQKFKVPARAKICGTIVFYPASVCFADGI
jgi:hypothetical protein